MDTGVIGRGAFGSVVTAKDREGKDYALKQISGSTPDDNSITAVMMGESKKKKCSGAAIRLLLEPIIMMSIRHPHLMAAENVVANSSGMTIIMKCASGTLICKELMEFTRLQRLSVQLISAILTLHQHHIIHGDIKPANILLLEAQHIALTDFGLSIIKEHPHEDFSHRVGTHTYRAPESMLKVRWNEKIDIWALGCTLYEMAYGTVLFPSQRDWDAGLNLDHDTVKGNGNQRGLNAILDWCNMHQYQYDTEDSPCKITRNSLPYHTVKLHPQWNDPQMAVFNDLVVKLLHPDPHQRPSITAVLRHPWVTAVTSTAPLPPYSTLQLSPVKATPDIDRLTSLLSGYFILPARVSTSFYHKTAELYSTINLENYDQLLLMLGCGWIIGKLYYHRIFAAKAGEHLQELPDVELAILTNIGYCISL